MALTKVVATDDGEKKLGDLRYILRFGEERCRRQIKGVSKMLGFWCGKYINLGAFN